MKVAIVGAGIAGLACAERLRQGGIEAVLFDKGKRPGGRLSTLRIDGHDWDFGAQFLLPRDPAFAAEMERWHGRGWLAPWPEGPQGALVGVPAMANLVERQCALHEVRFGTAVQRIERSGPAWSVTGTELNEGPFAAMILAIPAEQAAPLLSLHDLAMAREGATAQSQPCWTVMAAFAEPLTALPPFLREAGAIAWAARNNSKPGRPAAECWVIQASAEWSRQQLECPREDVAELLLERFAAETGQILPRPTFLKAHRWRFALSYGQHGATLWNPELRLGACGDWCLPPHIEGAWLSGVELGERIVAALLPDRVDAAAR